MSLYTQISFNHTINIDGKDIVFDDFQSKCGPNDMSAITPKALVEYDSKSVDDVDFYAYSGDGWAVLFSYIPSKKSWERRVFKRTGATLESLGAGLGLQVTDGNWDWDAYPFGAGYMEYEVYGTVYPETDFWTPREAFLQSASDWWDVTHGDKAAFMMQKAKEWDEEYGKK